MKEYCGHWFKPEAIESVTYGESEGSRVMIISLRGGRSAQLVVHVDSEEGLKEAIKEFIDIMFKE